MHTDGEPCLSSKGAPLSVSHRRQPTAGLSVLLHGCVVFPCTGRRGYSLRLPAPSGLGTVPL